MFYGLSSDNWVMNEKYTKGYPICNKKIMLCRTYLEVRSEILKININKTNLKKKWKSDLPTI